MSSLFSLYREVLPPSVVTHAAPASLVAPGSTNLVVAKSTILEIYNIVEFEEDFFQDQSVDSWDNGGSVGPANGHGNGNETRKTRKGARLELIAHRKLHGVIASLGIIRLAVGAGAEGRDSILLTFADAKVRTTNHET
jgi:cleavage and polyadenylation specificity factor subunit 1